MKLVLLCALLVTVAVFAVYAIQAVGKGRESKGEEQPVDYETMQVRAKVADMACSVRMVGTRLPKTVKEFSVCFETEEGKQLALMVPEEMYDGFEVGQWGVLTLVDGTLYSFEPEEG